MEKVSCSLQNRSIFTTASLEPTRNMVTEESSMMKFPSLITLIRQVDSVRFWKQNSNNGSRYSVKRTTSLVSGSKDKNIDCGEPTDCS